VARPIKEGIDYFSLDVDMDTADDRIFMLETDHGVEGFGILIKLLMTIYQQKGYFICWDETQLKRFSRKKNIKIDVCRNVINSAINLGFFSKKLYEKYGIITSRGIQKRYIEAAKKRKKIPFIREFLLLDPASEVNEGINLIYVGINSDYSSLNEVNSGIGTQSKVKQSKGKESKTKQIPYGRNRVNSSGKTKQKEPAPPTDSPSAHPPEFLSPNPNPPPRDGPLQTDQFGPDGKKLLSPEDVSAEKMRQREALKTKYPEAFAGKRGAPPW